MKIKQISLFLENRSGQLKEITKLLSDNNIDLKAINIAETADYGILRLISDNADTATSLLIENGFITTLTPVVAIAVPNVAGGLNQLLDKIADSNINIEYMYSVFGQKDGLAYMIFKVSDPDKLIEDMEKNGIKTADYEDLGIN